MLVYEKNNKLNINFDNEVNENPDLQIGKEDGKTQVLIDGQESGGGSSADVFKINVTFEIDEDKQISGVTVDKNPREIYLAWFAGKEIQAEYNYNKYWEDITASGAPTWREYIIPKVPQITAEFRQETDAETGESAVRGHIEIVFCNSSYGSPQFYLDGQMNFDPSGEYYDYNDFTVIGYTYYHILENETDPFEYFLNE